MVESKKLSLVKPTLQTPFHIDFEWWGQNDREWRVYLRSFLCDEHQQAFAELAQDEKVDWIDPDTAEVHQVDGLQHVLITHCAKVEGFVSQHTAIVEAIFRTFLMNGNAPMTVAELSDRLGKSPGTILRTLSGRRVYKGLRPIIE